MPLRLALSAVVDPVHGTAVQSNVGLRKRARRCQRKRACESQHCDEFHQSGHYRISCFEMNLVAHLRFTSRSCGGGYTHRIHEGVFDDEQRLRIRSDMKRLIESSRVGLATDGSQVAFTRCWLLVDRIVTKEPGSRSLIAKNKCHGISQCQPEFFTSQNDDKRPEDSDCRR